MVILGLIHTERLQKRKWNFSLMFLRWELIEQTMFDPRKGSITYGVLHQL